VLTRRLEVAFLLLNDPFAFRCSLCLRLFVPRGLNVTWEDFVNIDRDFSRQLCGPLLKVIKIREVSNLDKCFLHLRKTG
jgi:hypothetical protein